MFLLSQVIEMKELIVVDNLRLFERNYSKVWENGWNWTQIKRKEWLIWLADLNLKKKK